MVRGRKCSVARPLTTLLSGQALSGERQKVFSGKALYHSAIRAGPQWVEITSSRWYWLRLLGYQDRPSVVRDSEQSVAMAKPLGYQDRPLVVKGSEQSVAVV